MNKIPTAEEMEQSGKYDDYHSMMIEFTKLHIKAALHAAANTNVPPEYYGEENSKTRTSMDKHVILNAYPENLIV